MIKLRTLLETVELLPSGNLRITNLDDITPAQWERINRIMVQKGFNMRGGADCKRAVTNFINNPSHPGEIQCDILEKWVDTIATVLKLKPLAQTETKLDYDPKKVLRAAVRMFGLTHNLNLAGYILPNGGLLSLSGAGHSRDRDHREVAYVYSRLGIKIPNDQHHSPTPYMLAFVNDCNVIRIGGSQPQVDVYNMPTRQQAIQLAKFFSMYHGEIHLDVVSKKWGRDGRMYPKGTTPKRILRDIIAFFEKGELPPLPSTQNPDFKE